MGKGDSSTIMLNDCTRIYGITNQRKAILIFQVLLHFPREKRQGRGTPRSGMTKAPRPENIPFLTSTYFVAAAQRYIRIDNVVLI